MPKKQLKKSHFDHFNNEINKVKGFENQQITKVVLRKKNDDVKAAIKKMNTHLQADPAFSNYEIHSFEFADPKKTLLESVCIDPKTGQPGPCPPPHNW